MNNNHTAQIMRQKDAIEALEKRLRVACGALKTIATGRDKDGMKVDFPEDIAREALDKVRKMR